MFFHFARCLACLRSPAFRRSSFCDDCFDSLFVARSLCEICSEFRSENHECYPWQAPHACEARRSIISLYLLLGQTHAALTAWKRFARPKNTFELVRNALEREPQLRTVLLDHLPDLIVSMPQTLSRSFELGAQPSYLVATALVRALGIKAPIVDALSPMPSASGKNQRKPQQKLRSRIERNEGGMRFKFDVRVGSILSQRSRRIRVWIVDDFRTTGATLRAAETAIRFALPECEVVWVTLGYRPELSKAANSGAFVAAQTSVFRDAAESQLSKTG